MVLLKSQNVKGRDRWVPRVHWPASIQYLINSRTMRDSQSDLCFPTPHPPHTHACMHAALEQNQSMNLCVCDLPEAMAICDLLLGLILIEDAQWDSA